ncbi:hypothetical protein OVA24_05680 [Luteolibacter sp. SL250]|uniref:hypothetical protein n=1 Tax=Luteolibacter sp. SL250 TaxID=2995170 RepID=UPI00226FA101|nr:hypothetical protein [Luteolibacter sp. SL250]WAC20873.1 hypothetical protein OVA24_05680 [Luteolibacter sp. SL250]
MAGRGAWFGRAVIVLVVAGVLALGGAYLTLRNYLHSEGFRKFLSTKVSRAAGVEGEFSSFRWDGLAVDTDSFEGTGTGRLARLRADGLHTEIGFGGVSRGVWELKGTSVRRLEAEILASRTEEEKETPEIDAPVTKKERPKPWYPNEVELRGFDIGEADIRATLKDGKVLLLEDISVRAEAGRTKGSYSGEIRGGTLGLPDGLLPQLAIGRVKARYQEGVLFVTSADATLWGDGRLRASGEWDRQARSHAFEGEVQDVGLEHLVRENWSKRITGKVASDFTVVGGTGGTVARGTLGITDGKLTALPVLDVLAAYADTRRFRELVLTEARSDWAWKDDVVSLTDVVVASEGLLHIQGRLDIRGEELDGELMVGLAPAVLSIIRGTETAIFTPGERGLVWTRVKISGTVDDPEEDLSERLIAAAGVRILEELPGGDKVLKYSQRYLGAEPEEVIRKGIENFDEAEKAVRETRDLLKGIFGK